MMVYIVTKEVMGIGIYMEQNKNSKRTTILVRFECALRISLMKNSTKNRNVSDLKNARICM